MGVGNNGSTVESLKEDVTRAIGSDTVGSCGSCVDDDITGEALKFYRSVVGGGKVFECAGVGQIGRVEVDSIDGVRDVVDCYSVSFLDIHPCGSSSRQGIDLRSDGLSV